MYSIPITGATATTGSYFPQGNLTLVAGGFTCLGTEDTLADCDKQEPGCGHQNEAGVRCSETCDSTGALRLVGGSDDYEGRVEICQDGVWRSICQGTLWSQEDATVVCRQLDHSLGGTLVQFNDLFI